MYFAYSVSFFTNSCLALHQRKFNGYYITVDTETSHTNHSVASSDFSLRAVVSSHMDAGYFLTSLAFKKQTKAM